jgi:hypothetical protein
VPSLSSILDIDIDIDLDYFNLVKDPVQHLRHLLEWAERPVAHVVEQHHHVLPRWKAEVSKSAMTPPTHILHVDEHHDIMDGVRKLNIGNVMRHALEVWPECRVFWVAEGHIDAPGDWLDDELWARLKKRFKMGTGRPRGWPKPELVTVCTSPEFVDVDLLARLMVEVERSRESGRFVAPVPDVHRRSRPPRRPPT